MIILRIRLLTAFSFATNGSDFLCNKIDMCFITAKDEGAISHMNITIYLPAINAIAYNPRVVFLAMNVAGMNVLVLYCLECIHRSAFSMSKNMDYFYSF